MCVQDKYCTKRGASGVWHITKIDHFITLSMHGLFENSAEKRTVELKSFLKEYVPFKVQRTCMETDPDQAHACQLI